jgi:16S rRNA (guanine527-N7)-methyltransferase
LLGSIAPWYWGIKLFARGYITTIYNLKRSMEPDRIAELLVPFLGSGSALSAAQVHSISIYIDILLSWNARVNLTAVRQPEEIVTRHFGESLFAARHLFPKQESLKSDHAEQQVRLIDVGSGAGFPGLPIKIWAPHIHLTLIESNQKKVTFLREVIRRLSLEDADVFAGRLEDWKEDWKDDRRSRPREGEAPDIVTLRAVERFDSILPVAANMVVSSGRMALLVGEAQLERVRKLSPGLRWAAPIKLPCSTSKVLTIGRKESS